MLPSGSVALGLALTAMDRLSSHHKMSPFLIGQGIPAPHVGFGLLGPCGSETVRLKQV